MSQWTLMRVFELAISMEEESIKLYTAAQKKDLSPGSIKFLKELVTEEEKHKKKISEAIKDPSKMEEIGQSEDVVQDLKIVDYLKDVLISDDADYQQILIFYEAVQIGVVNSAPPFIRDHGVLSLPWR